MPRTTIGFYIEFVKAFTGEPRNLYNLVRELDRERFEPVVVTNKPSPLVDALRNIGVEPVIIPLPPEIGEDDGLAMRGGLVQKFKAFQAVRAYNRKLGEVYARHNARVVWSRGIKGVLLNYRAAKGVKAPLIWDIGMEWDSKGFVWLLHVFGFRNASLVTTESEHVARTIFTEWQMEKFKDKLAANPTGVPGDRVEQVQRAEGTPHRPGEPFIVLNVASVNNRKNQMMLLKALSACAADHPDVQVWFAGPTTDEAYEAAAHAYVKDNGLEDRVKWLGWQDDVKGLLHQAHLFAMPSFIEGVPQALLEAVHAHVPILACAAGGIPDVVKDGETGRLIATGDQEGFTAALKDCLGHRDKLPGYADKAKQLVHERFMAPMWYKRYEGFFEQLMAQPGA